jgi:TolB-like protein
MSAAASASRARWNETACSANPLARRDPARAAQPGTPSIAVLPFVDMSPEKNQEYFSDGLAEELLNDLAKIPGPFSQNEPLSPAPHAHLLR